ncbi:MAG: hypothetical protein PUD79_04570 [Prevotellaceae bacterium]|nr:hypothetical protein [Prevotellaceae bacterium]
MKLKNNLIVTLPDFAKHFDYNEFWENRRQFIRDMHPSKVYYWNNELLNAYHNIVTWINEDKDAEESIIQNGIHALEVLIDRPIRNEEIEEHESIPNLSNPIIRVQAGTRLDLPSYTNETFDNINLRYHKIEVYGISNKPAIITIGTKDSITLYATDFTYVTEVENLFIEFMPTHLQNNLYDLNLVSEEGNFFSSLNVKTIFTGKQMLYKDVISFAVTDDGYIYIDSHGKPRIMSDRIMQQKFIFEQNKEALYIKAKGTDIMILYKDGILKSTKIEPNNKVISASFDEECNINVTYM